MNKHRCLLFDHTTGVRYTVQFNNTIVLIECTTRNTCRKFCDTREQNSLSPSIRSHNLSSSLINLTDKPCKSYIEVHEQFYCASTLLQNFTYSDTSTHSSYEHLLACCKEQNILGSVLSSPEFLACWTVLKILPISHSPVYPIVLHKLIK